MDSNAPNSPGRPRLPQAGVIVADVVRRMEDGYRRGLPLRKDGLTVDEEAVNEVGAVEGLPPNRVSRLLLHLAPGRYEVFCNMAGHFMAGMSGTLVVE